MTSLSHDPFPPALKSLNPRQQKAVATLDGPVLVVAGPGTGKTQLLSLRAVNILRATDASARNILCLTYTDAGANAMRERIAQFVGAEAYGMTITTFHSFASEIISRYPQYFMTSDRHRTADELTQREILASLLDDLPLKHWLTAKHDSTYLYLRDLASFVSDTKRSGFSPDELREISIHNLAFAEFIAPLFTDLFTDRITKSTLAKAAPVLAAIEQFNDKPIAIAHFHSLSEIIKSSLARALEQAAESGKTTSLTEFKNSFCEKNDAGTVLKDAVRSQKLLDLADVYEKYLTALRARELSDFDDLILRVTQALEHFPALRDELQEQYQYIMVDEFQDTNAAQMRIVWHLTNADVHEGRPNILVVGDDDQGIYRFQGAELSNILDFTSTYRDVEIITLQDNYRSAAPILELARNVITTLEDRLENRHELVDKTLTPHYQSDGPLVELHRYETSLDELGDVAQRAAEYREQHPADTVAIIAHNNAQLIALSHHLAPHKIPVRYTRRDNIFDEPVIVQLSTLALIVDALARREFDFVDEKLAVLLTHPAWGVPADELWRLSIDAHRQRIYWLEAMMLQTGRLKDIAEWLVVQSHRAVNEPLERMLDELLGTVATHYEPTEPFDDDSDFISPLRQHFFAAEELEQHPAEYVAHLRALQVLREAIATYASSENGSLTLEDFVRYERAARANGVVLASSQIIATGENPLTLVTAHSAKGLEYDHVFIVGLTDQAWGAARTGGHSRLSMPRNVLIGSDTSYDELVRLLYVGLTRAKTTLNLSYHARHGSQSRRLVAGLAGLNLTEVEHTEIGIQQEIRHHEIDWKSRIIARAGEPSKAAVLEPIIENHRLSATEINTFLDLEYGGPQELLLKQILHFPEAPSLHAAYGNAVHAALSHAHKHFAATGKRRPIEDVLNDFEQQLGTCPLTDKEFASLSARGSQSLATYLGRFYDSFTPETQSEIGFATEHVIVAGVPVTGKVDLITTDTLAKTIVLGDYKTSAPKTSWTGKSDRDKRILASYRRQLMFYKLLVENSRSFRGYTVVSGAIHFVEPLPNGEAVEPLVMKFDADEVEEFTRLMQAIWRRIQALDFSHPDVESHDMKAVTSFVAELLG